jgi:hypothetical protein
MMLELLLSGLLVFAAASPLDGKWRRLDFNCQGGNLGPSQIKARELLRKGESSQLLTIQGSQVISEIENRKGAKACKVVLNEEWQIDPASYRVLKSSITKDECGKTKASTSGVNHRYSLAGDTLEFYLEFSKAKKPMTASRTNKLICSGTLISTFKRVK